MPDRVLLTGASGFVGHLLEPVLREKGHDVICATRDPARAAARFPARTWVHVDLEDPNSVARALEGCTAAYYLVHSIATGGDYPALESREATTFARRATDAGLRRVVYLGGVAPSGRASRHLQSRLHTGQVLRAEAPSAIELRAAMIIGEGSASWQMVRDLSARLPAMILPAWMQNRSSPVAVDDVLVALAHALELEEPGPLWLDVPGPEVMTHEELLRRVARLLRKRPPMMRVPLLTPSLSSYWVALVSDVDLAVARELVAGLQCDLLPSGPSIWDRMPGHRVIGFDAMVRAALAERARPEREDGWRAFAPAIVARRWRAR